MRAAGYTNNNDGTFTAFVHEQQFTGTYDECAAWLRTVVPGRSPRHRYGWNDLQKPQECQDQLAVCQCGHPVYSAQVKGVWRWIHCSIMLGDESGSCEPKAETVK